MRTIIVLIVSLIWSISSAQQNPTLVSPLVNEDGTVMFKLHAPLAQRVSVLYGDWPFRTGHMMKDITGIWSYKTEILHSDFYSYLFMVDSVRILDPSNPFAYRGLGNLVSVFIVNGGNGDYYSVNDVPHGNVIRTWYSSTQFKTDRRLTVYTPLGYDGSDQNYPVLYLEHGSGGDEDSWVASGRVTHILDNLIAEEKIEPMIVVMPNGNPSKQAAPGETTENFNYRPIMSQFLPNFADGSYVMAFNEIVNFIDSRFRTIPQKSHRAIAGFSMGGFHSLLISANHPDLFDYVGLFSPGTPSGRTGSLALDYSKPANSNLEEKYTIQKDKGYKLFWIAIGKTDFLYKPTQEHLRILDRLQFLYTYVETEGGHTWSNWREYMLQFTPLLFKE